MSARRMVPIGRIVNDSGAVMLCWYVGKDDSCDIMVVMVRRWEV